MCETIVKVNINVTTISIIFKLESVDYWHICLKIDIFNTNPPIFGWSFDFWLYQRLYRLYNPKSRFKSKQLIILSDLNWMVLKWSLDNNVLIQIQFGPSNSIYDPYLLKLNSKNSKILVTFTIIRWFSYMCNILRGIINKWL